jgi:hypothetical protein
MKNDCHNDYFTYSEKDGFCCKFHEDCDIDLHIRLIWLDNRDFLLKYGFEFEKLKKDYEDMEKAVNEGKTVMYKFDWFTSKYYSDRKILSLGV